MKTYQITAQTIVSAMKRQWKSFLAVVLAFAVLGAAGGWLYAGRGSSEEGGGGAQPLSKVDFQKVAYTQAHYRDCYQALSDSFDTLAPYLDTAFGAVALTEELAERRTALEMEMEIFLQNHLLPLQYTLREAGALYVPEEFLDGLTAQYESQLSAVRMDLLAAEVATETIRQMGSFASQNGDVINNYLGLLSQAQQYGTLLQNQASYEMILDRLRNETEQIRAGSRQVKQRLDEAVQVLNALLEDASRTADEIGSEAALDIHFQLNQKTGMMEPVVTHTYRASSNLEAAALVTLFCVLLGVCAGAFLAVCREAKGAPDKTASSSKKQA